LLSDEPPEAERIIEFATELGFDSFIFSPSDVHELERIAHDVLPAVREEISRRHS
jgi:alkanesulfonate monooxygenase SsuD/methylene tetrahydromethanopterin reductase-like flavin-dependent oxidoreductase (luciferase family)